MQFTRSVISCLTGMVVMGAIAFAAAPVGTASSSTDFQLNGVFMRSGGVSSWPVMPGDEIRSGGAPVVIRFSDGSRMTLSEQSRVRLVENGDGVGANVTGTAQFNLVPQSALKVYNDGRAVGARSGFVSSTSRGQAPQTSAPKAEDRRTPPPPLSSP